MTEMKEMHWLLDMIQNIDAGLLVLNRNYEIQAWNGFMENHSGLMAHQVKGNVLFDVFPDLDQNWFKAKAEPVFLLNNRAFTTWEQRERLFNFKNYHPITGTVDLMYQNITIAPLKSLTGETDQISIIIYDVTSIAVSKLQLSDANDRLALMAQTDSLSGLNNRRHWDQLFETEFLRLKRSGSQSALIMADIDDFKQINDRFGPPSGDAVIREVASQILHCQRETDISGRYGGSEFAILLTDTQAAQASGYAERLKTAVEQQVFVLNGKKHSITISLGISELSQDFEHYTDWIKSADRALYRAKKESK